MPSSSMARSMVSSGAVIFTPSSLSTSALPESELMALFPCLATATQPSAATTNAVAVEMLNEPVHDTGPTCIPSGFRLTLTRFIRARIAVAAFAIS